MANTPSTFPSRCTGDKITDKQLALGEVDIRSALRTRLFLEHGNEVDTVIIEELGLCRGQVRVDVAVVNGVLHGYEIKSDRDSLRRLNGQVEVYGNVLDRATVVVGDRHIAGAVGIVPVWWGVLRAYSTDTGVQFKTLRCAEKNPHKDARSLVELLWLDDAIALLEQRSAACGIRSKPRHIVWDRVCEQFATDEIAAAVRARLKARATNQAPA
jgi:hypothetical protein